MNKLIQFKNPVDEKRISTCHIGILGEPMTNFTINNQPIKFSGSGIYEIEMSKNENLNINSDENNIYYIDFIGEKRS